MEIRTLRACDLHANPTWWNHVGKCLRIIPETTSKTCLWFLSSQEQILSESQYLSSEICLKTVIFGNKQKQELLEIVVKLKLLMGWIENRAWEMVRNEGAPAPVKETTWAGGSCCTPGSSTVAYITSDGCSPSSTPWGIPKKSQFLCIYVSEDRKSVV